MERCSDGGVRFGSKGCNYQGECIQPFNQICSYEEPRKTDPMVLDAPHPRISIPLPPPDCACFSFEQQNGNVSIKPKADKTDPRFTVEIKQAGTDCCGGKYKVTPSIEIPECIMPDAVKSGSCPITGIGGTLNWTLRRINCELSLEMDGNIPMPRIPIPCLPTFNLESNISVKYKRKEGGSDQANDGKFKVKADTQNGCPLYTPTEIDLGVIGGGFNAGGDVFMGGGSEGFDDDKAYLTGKQRADTTWYGGGYGDLKNDDVGSTYCRGTKMRGGAALTSYGDTSIPVTTLEAVQQLVSEDGAVATVWRSQRDPEDENPDPTPAGVTVGSGNLDIVMPTGSQWNARGIALNLSQFVWNQSGLLSTMYEHNEAILVSPAPIVTSGSNPHNASGLAIDAAITSGSHPTEAGLRVNASDGLRIYGTDFGTFDPSDTADAEERNGSLEIMYGPGFRIRNADVSGVATYREKPVDAPGAIVPNDGLGLRVHGFTKMYQQYPNMSQEETPDPTQVSKLEIHSFDNDITFQSDGRIVFNDKTCTSSLLVAEAPEGSGRNAYAAYRGGSWKGVGSAGSGTDAEYTVPQLVSYYNPDNEYFWDYYRVDNGKIFVNGDYIFNYICDAYEDGELAEDMVLDLADLISQVFSTFGVMYQHVGKSGVVLGTDSTRNMSGIETRFAEQ